MNLLNIVSLQKIIQATFGFFTVIFVSYQLSDLEQAAFFSFNSFYSAYSMLDLGLSILLVQICSYWFSKEKNKSKLSFYFISFIEKSKRWYLFIGFICFFFFPIGFFYFNSKGSFNELAWINPWVLCIFSMSFFVTSLPYLAILEGMNKIREVYSIKILYYSIGTIISWLVIFSSNPLFAVSMVPLSAGIIIYLYIFIKYHKLFFSYNKMFFGNEFLWKKIIFPIQIKVIVTYVSNYIILFVPTLIFLHYGEVQLSAKAGITLIVLNMINVIASSNLIAKTPEITKNFSFSKAQKAKNQFIKELKKTVYLTTTGFLIIIIMKLFAPDLFFIERMLPISFLVFAALIFLLLQIINSVNIVFRANHLEFFYKELFILNVIFLLMLKFGFYNLFKQNIFLLYFIILLLLFLSFLKKNLQTYESFK